MDLKAAIKATVVLVLGAIDIGMFLAWVFFDIVWARNIFVAQIILVFFGMLWMWLYYSFEGD
jgi:high-affinity Fe2+/Pb2+ permease